MTPRIVSPSIPVPMTNSVRRPTPALSRSPAVVNGVGRMFQTPPSGSARGAAPVVRAPTRVIASAIRGVRGLAPLASHGKEVRRPLGRLAVVRGGAAAPSAHAGDLLEPVHVLVDHVLQGLLGEERGRL